MTGCRCTAPAARPRRAGAAAPAAMIARRDRSQLRATPGAAGAGGRRRRAVRRRHVAVAGTAVQTTTSSPTATATATPTARSARRARHARDLHGQARRHAVGDRARPTACTSRTCSTLNPDLDPQRSARARSSSCRDRAPAPRAADARRRPRPGGRRAGRPRAAPSRRPSSAPERDRHRRPDRRRRLRQATPDQQRPIASTTKLMTALLALEARRASSDVVAAAPLPRARRPSRRSASRPGERMTVADLLRGLLSTRAQRRRDDARRSHVAGSEGAFVRRMNRRAQQLGLDDTHYANPIGLDAPGNYSTARDLAKLARALRRNRSFRRTVNRRSGHAALRRARRAASPTATPARRRRRGSTASRPATPRSAGYVLVGSAPERGVRLDLASCSARRARRRATPTRWRCSPTASARTSACARSCAATRSPRSPITHRARRAAAARRGAHRAPSSCAGATRRHLPPRRRPGQLDGPIRRRPALGTARDPPARPAAIARVPLSSALEVPAASVARRTAGRDHDAVDRSCCSASRCWRPPLLVSRRRRRDDRRRPARGEEAEAA